MVVLKQSESELKESQKIFQELKNIEIVINDYQNILTNISRELEEAESEGNRLEKTNSERLYSIYFNKADLDVQDLVAWRDLLSNTLFR